jgi:hypothetical protein
VRRFGPLGLAWSLLQPSLQIGHAIADDLARQDHRRREVAACPERENSSPAYAEQFGRAGNVNK